MLKFKQVNEDERGEINVMWDTACDDEKEITIFRTNKGFARGGCIHEFNDELTIVIKGVIEHHIITKWNKKNKFTLCDGTDTVQILEKGDKTLVLKGKPHFFISKTDSITIEWGATLSEKQEKHSETREIVDKINKEMMKKNDKRHT